jgi:hypothetical protein
VCADLVDHHNADVEIGTVFPVILAVDHHVGADGVILLQLAQPRRELLGIHAVPTGTENRHKTAPLGQLFQSGLHQQLGFGSWDKHPRPHRKGQAKELPFFHQILQGFAGGAAAAKGHKRLGLLGGNLPQGRKAQGHFITI